MKNSSLLFYRAYTYYIFRALSWNSSNGINIFSEMWSTLDNISSWSTLRLYITTDFRPAIDEHKQQQQRKIYILQLYRLPIFNHCLVVVVQVGSNNIAVFLKQSFRCLVFCCQQTVTIYSSRGKQFSKLIVLIIRNIRPHFNITSLIISQHKKQHM